MRRAGAVVALLLISGCGSIQLTRVPTTVELMRALDLHMWWLPYNAQWTIEIIVKERAQPLGTKDAGLLHAGRESLISIRPLGGGHYEFTIDDRRGVIDVGGDERVRFFDPPRCNADCSAYIAGEVGGRQIVITSSR